MKRYSSDSRSLEQVRFQNLTKSCIAPFAALRADIGATLGSSDADLESMMALADKALHAAKAAGKGQRIPHGAGMPSADILSKHPLRG